MKKEPFTVSLPQQDEATWYKDAVIYEIHVRAFCDSNGDGIGDFRGLTQKLDYLQDLGVTALWLLPFYPSPLRDGGYDIADYTSINPDYGKMNDVKRFLKEAHARGLKVITELVLNHTSDQHRWFQRARRAKPGSKARDYYVWSDTPHRYEEARIIFQDYETSNWTWDPVAEAYYWHRFYSHQPDLNYDNPHVRKSMMELVDYWFALGVDGMRLDAVPYLFQREGTNCENLPETHEYLKALRRHIDSKFENRMLLAEANQWPEDSVAYFGDGDECHMAFHFPVMPRLFMAIRMEDHFPILEIMRQTPAIPENCQWATFLRNHDELTLEMVTDEERDYMYRAYAYQQQMRVNLGIRRRLAPLLGNNRRQIELMNALLFSLPGTPVLYYGDEIGMGDNIYLGDRDSVRTPMQWNTDRNAGFSTANPQKLYLPLVIDPEYHFQSVNVEAQQNNPHSLLWWTKHLIDLRKRCQALSRGDLHFLKPHNARILAFLRRYGNEQILVVANLSRYVQWVELDLSEYEGYTPVELFGHTTFPRIGPTPYRVSLHPYGFFWFSLNTTEEESVTLSSSQEAMPTLRVRSSFAELFQGRLEQQLSDVLWRYLRQSRWFASKTRTLRTLTVQDVIPLSRDEPLPCLLLINLDYNQGDPEQYMLSLTAVETSVWASQEHTSPVILATLSMQTKEDTTWYLVDATQDLSFCQDMLDCVVRRRHCRGQQGSLQSSTTRALRHHIQGVAVRELRPTLMTQEQSNSSVKYGDKMILKFFRRVHEGINPDLEISQFLTEQTSFTQTPSVLGSLTYQTNDQKEVTVAMLQAYVSNDGDAWTYTLAALGRYLEHALTESRDVKLPAVPQTSLLEDLDQTPPAPLDSLLGSFLESIELLGQRTAEMHLALFSNPTTKAFTPEAFTSYYQRSIYQSARNLASRALQMLQGQVSRLSESNQLLAQRLLSQQDALLERCRNILDHKIVAQRGRIHGDYHLGQVLHAALDFVIIDFEGEPARAISERRIKRSPLRDVAGMIRSFYYATHYALYYTTIRREDVEALSSWEQHWLHWVSKTFLRSYLSVARTGTFLPEKEEDIALLLDLFMVNKAMYELAYELNNRPSWVGIPLTGALRLLEDTQEETS